MSKSTPRQKIECLKGYLPQLIKKNVVKQATPTIENK